MVSLKDYYGLTVKEIFDRALANGDLELAELLRLCQEKSLEPLHPFYEKPENGL